MRLLIFPFNTFENHFSSAVKKFYGSAMELDDAYSAGAYDYLAAKGLGAAIIGIDMESMRIAGMKSSVSKRILRDLLSKELEGEEVAAPPSWLSEEDKLSFPDSPGHLQEIMKNKRRTEQFASQVMKWWKGVRGQKMGCGEFKAWDRHVVDMGSLPLLLDQVERVRGQLGGFTFTMDNIIAWKDLLGMHGLSNGNIKAVKVDWMWVEVLRFFILWSYLVVGRNIQEGVNMTWTPNSDDFVKKSKTEVEKKSKTEAEKKSKTEDENKSKNEVKKKSTEAQKLEGKKKGLKRAKATKAAKADDFELALALLA